jgi:2-oxoglutarate ferredoxin oxidoreductase subunit delta
VKKENLCIITIDEERCKGCALCIDACKERKIRISDEANKNGIHVAKFIKSDSCKGCKMCAIICPDCAIEIYRNNKTE